MILDQICFFLVKKSKKQAEKKVFFLWSDEDQLLKLRKKAHPMQEQQQFYLAKRPFSALEIPMQYSMTIPGAPVGAYGGNYGVVCGGGNNQVPIGFDQRAQHQWIAPQPIPAPPQPVQSFIPNYFPGQSFQSWTQSSQVFFQQQNPLQCNQNPAQNMGFPYYADPTALNPSGNPMLFIPEHHSQGDRLQPPLIDPTFPNRFPFVSTLAAPLQPPERDSPKPTPPLPNQALPQPCAKSSQRVSNEDYNDLLEIFGPRQLSMMFSKASKKVSKSSEAHEEVPFFIQETTQGIHLLINEFTRDYIKQLRSFIKNSKYSLKTLQGNPRVGYYHSKCTEKGCPAEFMLKGFRLVSSPHITHNH